MIHELKTWPVFFQDQVDGDKDFEVRKDDRGYKRGDTLIEQEYDPDAKSYTGRMMYRAVLKVFHDIVGVQEGYVVLALGPATIGHNPSLRGRKG